MDAKTKKKGQKKEEMLAMQEMLMVKPSRGERAAKHKMKAKAKKGRDC